VAARTRLEIATAERPSIDRWDFNPDLGWKCAGGGFGGQEKSVDLDGLHAISYDIYCLMLLRQAVFAPPLRYPYQLQSRIYGDSSAWTRYEGNGLYRVLIDMSTGHVNQVVTIQSTGQAFLDKANTNALKRWIFNPGKWKEVTIPVVVRTKAVGVLNKSW
jgi:hypothetical protein